MSGQRVGIVGDEAFAGAIETAGAVAIGVGSGKTAFDDVDFLLADSEEAVTEIARSGREKPVIAVEVGGIPSVPADRVDAAIKRMLGERPRTERHPIVGVSGSFGSDRAVFDVALMAAEPARISEFSVRGPPGRTAEFRADGVVVSTPAGSHGYGRRAGGPVVAAETGVVSIVPIAPFATSAGQWIVPTDSAELAVVRDETPVELLVDGARKRVIPADDPIRLSRVGSLEAFVFPDLEA